MKKIGKLFNSKYNSLINENVVVENYSYNGDLYNCLEDLNLDSNYLLKDDLVEGYSIIKTMIEQYQIKLLNKDNNYYNSQLEKIIVIYQKLLDIINTVQTINIKQIDIKNKINLYLELNNIIDKKYLENFLIELQNILKIIETSNSYINKLSIEINNKIHLLQEITILKTELKPLVKLSSLINSYKKDATNIFNNLKAINIYILEII